MKIAVCGSMAFAKELKKAQNTLEKRGWMCFMPDGVDGYIDRGEDIKGTESARRKIAKDLIRRHYNYIKESDAVLVLNYDKRGVKNYIGGNTFLEMGFAHVLNKPIYLLNPIPAMGYTDEIMVMRPTVLDGDFSKIPKP